MKPLFSLASALLFGATLFSAPATAQSAATGEAYYEEQPRLTTAVFPAADPLKVWMIAEKEDPRSGLTIELLDAQNNQLYATKVGRLTKKVRQRFDLSDMPDGRYTFRISDGNTVQERVIKVSSPGLSQELPKRLVTMN